jgi:hypothetical protein
LGKASAQPSPSRLAYLYTGAAAGSSYTGGGALPLPLPLPMLAQPATLARAMPVMTTTRILFIRGFLSRANTYLSQCKPTREILSDLVHKCHTANFASPICGIRKTLLTGKSQITSTLAPTGTRSYRSMISSLSSRTHPLETALPIDHGSFVPCTLNIVSCSPR